MNDKLLNNALHNAITRNIITKLCAIDDATGNILKYNNRFYVVTCKHVADDFFRYRNSYILLKDNSRIYINKLKYVASTQPKTQADIALIEILESEKIKDFFEENDLEIIKDFKEINSKDSFLFICGFPEQLNFIEDGKQKLPYFSFGTNKSTVRSSDEDFIYLDYDMNKEHIIIHEKNLKAHLPKAPGLSGAFIFKIDVFRDKPDKIWYPSKVAKAIAIQATWKKAENWIKGSSTKFLFELLEKSNSSLTD